jgi:hypothetical protein
VSSRIPCIFLVCCFCISNFSCSNSANISFIWTEKNYQIQQTYHSSR